MAKVQTRRSISVSRPTYERLKAYCEGHGISMSQFVEGRIGEFFAAMGSQAPIPPIAPKPTPKSPIPAPAAVTKTVSASNEQQASHIFTF